MTIQKRSLPVYILLNCLTLGIYGAVVSSKIGNEINALCKGDGEEPKLSYFGAVLIRSIPTFLGLITGLIVGLVSESLFGAFSRFYFSGYIDINALLGSGSQVNVVISMISFAISFAVIGSFASGLYLKYWWFKQTNRLKLNAGRYGLTVKESGTDALMFRTVLELLVLPITLLALCATILIPALIVWLCSFGSSLASVIFALIFLIPILMFSAELTSGSYLSMYFVMKNLNRYADVYQNGAKPFDSMAYEYYPSSENFYHNYVPSLISGDFVYAADKIQNDEINVKVNYPKYENVTPVGTEAITKGKLIGVKGSCAGYQFDLMNGEEIIIGKDASVASVIIDKAYKEISRKHVGVTYDSFKNQYRIVDYSSNGTYVNGNKLSQGREFYFPHGAELRLANDKNIFRLG